MPDRETVIKALHCRAQDLMTDLPACDGCDYQVQLVNRMGCDFRKLCRDVIALLKEQEARVMTLDQLEDALDTVVWLETPVSENLADGYSLIMAYSHKYEWMFFDSPFGDNPSQDRLKYSEYGKSWRCWDRRPTDEQRNAVKWE